MASMQTSTTVSLNRHREECDEKQAFVKLNFCCEYFGRVVYYCRHSAKTNSVYEEFYKALFFIFNRKEEMGMKYITIEREYGSGGTLIGKELAARCGIPCYGQEILERASERLQISVDEIRRYEEKVTNSMLYSLYMLCQTPSMSGEMLSSDGKVFVEEQNAIKEFASQGSAIFMGHCASEALKEYDHVLRVYIHADAETKKERIMKDYGIAEVNVAVSEKKNNKRRASYYAANTQRKWNDFHNYDIVLDSSKLGIDGCVKLLAGIF